MTHDFFNKVLEEIQNKEELLVEVDGGLPGVKATPPEIRNRSLNSAEVPRSEAVAQQVAKLSSLGISKHSIAAFLDLKPETFSKLYEKDLVAGTYRMNVKLASLAMAMAEAGDSKMVQFLCKTKLGWTETSTIEHIGEVKAVISAKPLTEEEFEKQYLSESTEDSEES